jgi:crossover junction endodeoxyribonuclease RusA
MSEQEVGGASFQVSARLCLTLPLPPSINEQYATVNGHRVLTAVARRFKGTVVKQVKDLRLEGKLSDHCIECLQRGFLAIYLRFYFSTPLKRDLDGPLKICIDSLVTEGLGINDNRVVDIHLSKFIDPLHERVEVELEALVDWQFDESYVVLPVVRTTG